MNKELIDKFKTITKKIENPVIKNLLIEMIDTIEEQIEKITNLEQENKDLSRMCELYSKSLYNAELTDYKSRNEKAIEFNQIVLDSDYVYSQDEIAQKNLNILQGEDKE